MHQVGSRQAWKQLCYICHDYSAFTQEDDEHLARHHRLHQDRQPVDWDSWIRERDGTHTGAGVEIFIAKKEFNGQKHMVRNPSKPEVFDNDKAVEEARQVRQGLTEPSYQETMIIVRRGNQASLLQAISDLDILKEGVKERFERESWKSIKEVGQPDVWVMLRYSIDQYELNHQ
jgi:hypothetical protein